MGRAKRKKHPCPHCGKTFQAEKGLEYHVKEYVCRQSERPGGPVIKGKRKVIKDDDDDDDTEFIPEENITAFVPENKGKRKMRTRTKSDDTGDAMLPENNDNDKDEELEQDDDDDDDDEESITKKAITTKKSNTKTAKKQYKKIRGSLKDRTCPICKNVFTSILGKTYHFNNKVCSTKQAKSQNPYSTLIPGQFFVTTYGILKVIQDDRAIPIAEYSSDLESQFKLYTNWKIKRAQFIQRKRVAFTVISLTKRRLLRKAYEENNINQQTVFRAYFGDDPRFIDPSRHSKVIKTTVDPKYHKVDPHEPIGSYPDRIVICQVVQDRRIRIGSSLESDTSQMSSTDVAPVDPHWKHYTICIQRRFLTESYLEVCTMQCKHCGQIFTSQTGFKYHLRSSVCTKKVEVSKEANKAFLHEIDEQASSCIDRPEVFLRNRDGGQVNGCLQLNLSKLVGNKAKKFNQEPSNEDTMATETPISDVSANVKSKKLLVYSKQKEDGTPVIVKVAKQVPLSKIENIKSQLVSPIDEYNQMVDEFYYLQGKQLGPMYQGVFVSLGYQKPKGIVKKKKKKKRRKEVQETPLAAEEENISNLPLAPIIDTRGFISEVDAGRYLTIRRIGMDVEHESLCCACKQDIAPEDVAKCLPIQYSKDVLPCTLCTNVVHFSCMVTKVTVKIPEPDDDFVCYQCIRKVLTRRQRAKKRRIEKFHESLTANPSNNTTTTSSSKKPQTMITDINDIFESVRLTKGIISDEEYECLAAQGKQINDLSELLRDGTKRLKRNLEYSSVNRQYRRNLIKEVEHEYATL